MCGIVGLFLKRPGLEDRFGALLAGMLATLHDRGPDSAGFAVYGDRRASVRLTIRDDSTDLADWARSAGLAFDRRDNHLVLHVPVDLLDHVRDQLRARASAPTIVGEGYRMEVYKAVGAAAEITGRFGLSSMTGTHGIGHTRMATESAVTTDGAHPYTTGLDQCLVHNGSLSNHCSVRRRLVREGLSFATENDTEVAAAFLSWRMREGDTLEKALEAARGALDGFYTFVVGTGTGFAVLRDPIGCKPAVMAQTDDWVAFGSEYRAFVDLPGIDDAHVWEPEPARAYVWDRAA